MKKWTLFLSLYFCTALILGGCGQAGSGAVSPAPPDAGAVSLPESDAGAVSGEPAEQAPQTVTCRVVTAGEDGTLLLAELGETAAAVYTLSAPGLEVRPGQLMDVTYEELRETWPIQLSGAAEPREDGFDDRCALYLQVLEDLWQEDPGLNGDVELLGVDLSATSLTPGERSAVAWAFAENHGAELVEGTMQQLVDGGYLTAYPLAVCGTGGETEEPKAALYEWENGCLYSIKEKEMEGVYSLTPVTFDAGKWRSGTGAYYFCDCTALQSASGAWSGYTVGAHAIS